MGRVDKEGLGRAGSGDGWIRGGGGLGDGWIRGWVD